MKISEIQNLLIIGLDPTAIANSAKKAGYNIHVVDHYGDQDLKKTCETCSSIITQEPGKTCGHLETSFSPQKLLPLAKNIIDTHQIDAILLASGLEDAPQVLTELHRFAPIIGNHPQTIQTVRDKIHLFHSLKRLKIPHPATAFTDNLQEAKKAAKDLNYPVIVKPSESFGGARIGKATNKLQLETLFKQITPYSLHEIIIQECITGQNASISLLSTKQASILLTLNEQLLGIQTLGQDAPFGYCGNIVPASASRAVLDYCSNIAEKIAAHFKLNGSNGIDVVISKDGTPYVVEVNPRFQGTLECVERVLGINLVRTHIEACLGGFFPTLNERSSLTCCVRLILYAHQRLMVSNLSNIKEARDIPCPGVVIEAGEPLCSLVVDGKARDIAWERAVKLAKSIYALTRPIK